MAGMVHTTGPGRVLLWWVADLDERLTAIEHCLNGRPRPREKPLQVRIGRVATAEQDDLRRRPVVADQLGEVHVLGHDAGAGGSRGLKDLCIARTL